MDLLPYLNFVRLFKKVLSSNKDHKKNQTIFDSEIKTTALEFNFYLLNANKLSTRYCITVNNAANIIFLK